MSQQQATREDVFIDNMKSQRKDLGWTQTDLAREMKERGFPFHQQTVQRIEDGRRPVRLDEAYAMAEVFDTGLETMTLSIEGMIRRVATQAIGAVVTPASDAWNAYPDAFVELATLAEEIESRMVDPDRAAAGAAIIARAVHALDRISADMKKAMTPIWSGLADPSSEPDEPPSDEETYVRTFVGAHKVPGLLQKLSTGELLDIYAPGKRDSAHG